MTVGPAEIWVCAQCRSVNQLKAKQCYRCRTPKSVGQMDPATMPVMRDDKLREIVLPPFHSTRFLAVLASILVLGWAALQILGLVVSLPLFEQLANGVAPSTTLSRQTTINLSLLDLIEPLVALIAWALWLSRVVTVIPALGLGYPASGGISTFVENFIPFFNLFRVPAIVRDIARRLSPGTGRGDALIAAAWIGIFGGFLLPRIGIFVVALGANSLRSLVNGSILFAALSTSLIVIGAIFLVMLIWWVEARISEHRARQATEAAAVAPAAPVPVPVSAPVTPVAAAPSFAAAVGGVSARPAFALPVAPVPEPTLAPAEPAPKAIAAPEEPMPPSEPTEPPLSAEPTPPPVAPPVPPIMAPAFTLPNVTSGRPPVATGGPHCKIRVDQGRLIVAVDDDPPETVDLDDLRAAAGPLAGSGGRATVMRRLGDPASVRLTEVVIEVLETNDVPVTVVDTL